MACAIIEKQLALIMSTHVDYFPVVACSVVFYSLHDLAYIVSIVIVEQN